MKFAGRLFLSAAITIAFITGCTSHKRPVPDVSGITVPFTVERFDRDLFSIDTNHIPEGLDSLQRKYGSFLNDYLFNILGLAPQVDSVPAKLKLYLHDYAPIYDSVQRHFPDMKPQEKELLLALQLTRHYFPQSKLPEKLVCFVGPIEGYGNVITATGFAVGLQLYLGKEFPAYYADYVRDVYPAYQSRRFEAPYIATACMRNLLDDMYPAGNNNNKPLVDQMVELGKRLYVLDLLLPETADSIKTGYKQFQLDGCYENEALIWNYFVKNDLLYITDPLQTREYINDGPKTSALGEEAPGCIGMFTGWQIVKKWMEQHKEMTPSQLMTTPARQIFEEAKYKPR
ncbi:hypothetical protein SAMN05421788_1011543 [Filimonas lacunae]|uniref:Gliding motility-associated lipoprotein GldB n=1 Tax=Filimonas lacunae TaxID=477680 RepID=A0A173MR16_9BACT|nr:hypothetical protein [Filimonas lacunae]BAV10115.1 gliding motility protein GldB [Filimonas lacunae]SIS84229.1 hypothetical protein SAMN05421788_1011543 [Filimonas lacunae]